MQKPKISIIMPVYKAQSFLERSVSSIQNQTLKEIEIILVDDGSPDESGKICDSFKEKDNRIKVIHKQNEGAGMARNSALEIAEGEYIGFVDSDDYVDLKMYEVLYGKAKLYDADIVLSGVCFVGGNMYSKENEVIKKNYFDKDTLFDGKDGVKKLCLGVAGALPRDSDDSRFGASVWKNIYRADVIKENNLRFLSEREFLSEDVLFTLDYLSYAKKGVGINGAFYHYVRNDFSVSKAYNEKHFERCLVFLNEVEKRLCLISEPEEYKIYLQRLTQGYARILSSQEIVHADNCKMHYKELKSRLDKICRKEEFMSVLKTYPWYKLPMKQAAFCFAMKHRLTLLKILFVKLRSR